MLDKLNAIKDRFNEVSKLIVDPAVINDMSQYIKLNKEYKDLEPIVKTINKYIKALNNISEAKDILKNETDLELKELAKIDLEESSQLKIDLEDKIKFLLIPKDPDDSRNAVVEIRLVLEEMRRVYLQVSYLGCILNLLTPKNVNKS